MTVGGWVAASPAPGPVTRGAAQAAARAELTKRGYHRNDPSLVERALVWFLKKLGRLLDASVNHAPGHGIGLLLIVAIMAGVVVLIVARVGGLRRSPRIDTAIFGVEETTADDHRRRAVQYADGTEWALAVREWLRAIARELEQRGLLDPRPGRTADELCHEAGTQLPAVAGDLAAATSAFDAVWYGGRPATGADEQLLRGLDSRIAGSHRNLLVTR
jgi:Domain of unknown function (DUF4129)